MNKLKITGFISLFCCLQTFAFAQTVDPQVTEPVDFMRSEGKLYVVMAVVVTIMLGIIIYLVNLDRKIKKLEKEI
ncbi:MAG TPA: hypothetical protein PLA68_10100 [Panacibacter sp.]|nr:hypothetical protein [Panacibacter sp.]